MLQLSRAKSFSWCIFSSFQVSYFFGDFLVLVEFLEDKVIGV
jgi:hypothetical protein